MFWVILLTLAYIVVLPFAVLLYVFLGIVEGAIDGILEWSSCIRGKILQHLGQL